MIWWWLDSTRTILVFTWNVVYGKTKFKLLYWFIFILNKTYKMLFHVSSSNFISTKFFKQTWIFPYWNKNGDREGVIILKKKPRQLIRSCPLNWSGRLVFLTLTKSVITFQTTGICIMKQKRLFWFSDSINNCSKLQTVR